MGADSDGNGFPVGGQKLLRTKVGTDNRGLSLHRPAEVDTTAARDKVDGPESLELDVRGVLRETLDEYIDKLVAAARIVDSVLGHLIECPSRGGSFVVFGHLLDERLGSSKGTTRNLQTARRLWPREGRSEGMGWAGRAASDSLAGSAREGACSAEGVGQGAGAEGGDVVGRRGARLSRSSAEGA
eukprot:SAG31_NODE_438_length_15693_cov_6.254248_16_plen_185_part_00